VLIGYAGRVRWPLGLPTGFIAVVVGALTAWLLRDLQMSPMPEWPTSHLTFYFPVPIVGEIFSLLTDHAGLEIRRRFHSDGRAECHRLDAESRERGGGGR
jgi:hypothetical protein